MNMIIYYEGEYYTHYVHNSCGCTTKALVNIRMVFQK